MARRDDQASTRDLVRLAALLALAGAAVCGLALAGRSLVSGAWDGVLLAVAVLGASYAVMCVGGALLFGFFDGLSKNPDRTVRRWRVSAWTAGVVGIPVSSYLLGFDRDQWIWGTGSALVGVVVVQIVLHVPARTRSSR